MKVLAVTAHPDDAEISCGGTLAKYAKQGNQVSILHVCNGNKGDFMTEPQALAEIRCEEARKSGALIGAEVICLGFGDAEIFYTEENLGILVDAMRDIDPDVIFTHNPKDYHLDHQAVSKLVTDASFLLSVPSYRPNSKASHKMPQIYFLETYSGIGFLPTDYVDISGEMSTKLAMMDCHKSQQIWMKEHDNVDIMEFLEVGGKYRGYQCGTTYAECFRRYLTALRSVPGQFLP